MGKTTLFSTLKILPLSFVIVVSVFKISWVEYFPIVQIIFGSIIFSCSNRYFLHLFISSNFGSLFSSGLHLSTFAIKTSLLLKPMDNRSSSRIFPACPTNGLPCKSSFLPGASPINTISALELPLPKTKLVRVLPSSHSKHSLIWK